MAKVKGRYEVTGPGLDESRFYEDFGPALSLTITKASASRDADGTWYVRDLDGTVLGYSESDASTHTVVTVSHTPSK